MQVSPNTKVVSLIRQDGGRWDIDFLKPIVLPEEYEAILAIHIGDPSFRDTLIWPFDKRGIYFVKSGYPWLYSGKVTQTNFRSSSSFTISELIWKKV